MNIEHAKKLVERCSGSANYGTEQRRVWSKLFGDCTDKERVSCSQVSMLVFAAQVETWAVELERVLEILRAGHGLADTPMCGWSEREWLAACNGRLTAVDVQMVGQLACLTAWERDNTPGFLRMARLFEQATELCYKLRGLAGMNQERAA